MADSVSSKVVDFTNVKEGGTFNKKRVPAGDYLAKVTKVQDAEAKSDKTFQWLFTISLENAAGVYPYYCKLQENQLWKLRNLFVAAGITVPKKKMKVDPSKVVGKFIGVTMEDDEYEGKAQSNIASVFPASELAEGDADDDEDEEDEEGEEEAEDEEVDDEDDSADDDEEDEEEEPEPPAPKKRAAKAAPARRTKVAAKKKAKPTEEDDELEELDLEGL
jgi:ribosomal protein L12E/L44/L45/RPP1/RPP2